MLLNEYDLYFVIMTRYLLKYKKCLNYFDTDKIFRNNVFPARNVKAKDQRFQELKEVAKSLVVHIKKTKI